MHWRLIVAVTGTAVAQRGATSASTGAQSNITTRIVASAQSLLKTLDDAGRAKVQYRFDSHPARGIRASALSAPQQTLRWDLVKEWAGFMNDAFAEPRVYGTHATWRVCARDPSRPTPASSSANVWSGTALPV